MNWRSPRLLVPLAMLAVVGAVGAWLLFAPDASTHRDDALGDVADFGPGQGTPLLQGTWQGSDSFHFARGEVTLYRDTMGLFLFFESFEARAGPDVYLYASPHADAEHVRDAVKIPVDGGAGDGRATLRGDFRVDVPAGLAVDDVASLVLWCDDFGVHFGSADLA